MNTVGKIVSSVSELFEFNQATLSGCVDIIVVEQPDGSLRSTPFHVRFGKFKVLKSKDKIVKIHINDNESSLTMKLGEAGEGFFEEEVIKSKKDIQLTEDVLVIPDIEVDMAEVTKQKDNIRQGQQNTRGLLQLKHSASNENTSAQTKGISDQYGPYTGKENSEAAKHIVPNDLEELLLGNQQRTKSAPYQLNTADASHFNKEISPLSKSAKLEHSSKPKKFKTIKVKTLRPSSDRLRSLNLRQGANTITYTIQSGLQGLQTITGHIYLWPSDANIIISDIDGTITKSDVLGHMLPMFGKDWSQPGIAPLYSNLRRNGYHILYLTSRPIGQAGKTKSFLQSIYQDGKMLPHGPLIMSPDRFLPSVKREIIFRRPELFKMAALKDVKSLFPTTHDPFHAGFGNRETDAVAYRSVNIPLEKIFIVNPQGHIDHHSNSVAKSYALINTMIKEMFPGVLKNEKCKLSEALDPANVLSLENENMINANTVKVIS